MLGSVTQGKNAGNLFCPMHQKASKTRTWSALNTAAIDAGKQAVSSLHDNDAKFRLSGLDARISKSTTFFSGLFSRATTSKATITAPTNSATLHPPRPSPTATDPSTIPPNLTMRNISPDLYNDPAFSPDPRSHPLFVTNPDIPTPPPSPPALKALSHEQETPITTASEQARLTPLPSPRFSSAEEKQSTFHRTTLSPPILTTYSSSSSESESASSTAYSTELTPSTSMSDLSTPSSSSSSLSADKNQQPRKGLIILNPPPPSPPPPPYDEPQTTLKGSMDRPQPAQSASTPNLQLDPVELPVRSATNPASMSRPTGRNNSSTNVRHIRGLDPIDELDETNPLGLALHHDGPYEGIPRLTQQGDKGKLQASSGLSQQGVHKVPRKPVSNPPFLADSASTVPYVPFGAPLNINPGQIVPRNFQPYTQPTPQPNTQSQSRHRQDAYQTRPNQPSAQSQPPPQSQQQTRPHVPHETSQPRPQISFPTSQSPPIPTLSNRNERHRVEEEQDFEDAYGGIEEADPSAAPQSTSNPEKGLSDQSLARRPLQPIHQQHSFNPTDLPSGAAYPNVIGGNTYDDDDAVARALYVVARERARAASNADQARDRKAAVYHPELVSSEAAYYDYQYEASGRQQTMLPGRTIQQFTDDALPTSSRGYDGYAPTNSRVPDPMAFYGKISSSSNPYAVEQPNLRGYGEPSYNTRIDPPHRSHDIPPAARKSPTAFQYPSSAAQQMRPGVESGALDPHDPVSLIQQRRYAPSSKQSIATTAASRSGPLPRHIPKNLVMPTPLQYNSTARNGQAAARPQVQFQSQSRVPTPSTPINTSSQRNTPPMTQRAYEAHRVQAHYIPMAGDSRKVLRKRNSLNPTASNNSHGGMRNHSMSEMPDWIAPGPGYPPSRSKSESRPPVSTAPSMKAPKRVLSKRK